MLSIRDNANMVPFVVLPFLIALCGCNNQLIAKPFLFRTAIKLNEKKQYPNGCEPNENQNNNNNNNFNTKKTETIQCRFSTFYGVTS